MGEHWREILYPLGFISSLMFTARMLLQWVKSEVKGKSFVSPIFWKLSLVGNISLALHAFLQVQFHVFLIQMCNAIISWRNLNLMQPSDLQISTKRTVHLMGLTILASFFFFLLQEHLLNAGENWFRIPVAPWQSADSQARVYFLWHVFGFIGLALFSSRFWIQWWSVERRQESYLGSGFWWVSLVGELICLIYFLKINDAVNFIGPLFALIPYIRNLMLIKKNKNQLSQN